MAVDSIDRDASDVEHWNRFRSRFRHHPTKGGLAKSIEGDVIADPENWFAYQDSVSDRAGDEQRLKFSALYVDLDEDGVVRTPRSAITEDVAHRAVARLGASIRYWVEFFQGADLLGSVPQDPARACADA